jgi:sulfonate dioxygenase
VFNPFYSPDIKDNNDESYPFAQYKVRVHMSPPLATLTLLFQPHFPNVEWPPLEEQQVTERGKFGDPNKSRLAAVASKIKHLTPAIGTEIEGVDLRQLTDDQKDDLCAFFLFP